MKKQNLILFLIISIRLYAQVEISPLPLGFQDIVVGLTLDETKSLLEKNGYFDYRGDPDVSMLLTDNRSIIESKGSVYIDNGYFQFYKDVLYTITLILDTKKIDYHTIYTTFTDKYGKHTSLNPKVVTWQDDRVKITLEKPLTIKYVSLVEFNEILESDTTEKAIQERLREDFINEF